MALNEDEIKREFHSEVRELCEAIGVKEIPLYALKISSYHSARVKQRFLRTPLVEIGQIYESYPYALAAEAAHVVFDFARKRLGLRRLPAYGETFDFLNQLRKMYLNGDLERAERFRSSGEERKIGREVERILAEAAKKKQNPYKTVSELSRYADKIERKHEGKATIAHIASFEFTNLISETGIKDPSHIADFMRILIRRNTHYGDRLLSGDYSGFLDEFRFFREEPRKIMESNYRREIRKLVIPKRKKKKKPRFFRLFRKPRQIHRK